MRVCVCTHTCVYACLCVCVYVYVYVCTYVCVLGCACVRVFVCVCVCDEQCARRYEELLASNGVPAQQMAKAIVGSGGSSHSALSDADPVSRQSISSSDSSKQKGTEIVALMRHRHLCSTEEALMGDHTDEKPPLL